MAALLVLLLLQESDGFRRVDQDAHCVECHEYEADDLKGSVHEKEGCVGCHGSDEVNPRQTRGNPHRKLATFTAWRGRNLTDDCGACHGSVLEALRETSHYVDTRRPAGSMKKGCMDCHGNHHMVKPAQRDAVLKECAKCHEDGSAEMTSGRKLADSMTTLDRRLFEAEQKISRTHEGPGVSPRQLAEAAAAGRRVLKGLRTRQHGMKFDALNKDEAVATDQLDTSYKALEDRERAFGRRWVAVAPLLAFLASAVVLLQIKTRLRKGTE